MTETTDWEQWRSSWQRQTPTPRELDEAIARFERANRRDTTLRVIEWVVVALGVVFPVAAMGHAANVIEAVLGIGATAIVLGVAAFREWNRRAERTALGTSAQEFDDAVRALRRLELRFVRVLWLVLAVEGVFAAVWWYGGISVHHDVISPVAVGMLWLPLIVVAATLVWSIRLRASARRELDALATSPRTSHRP